MLYLLILLTAVAQATLLNVVAIGSVKPDLLLVIVLFAAFYTDGWLNVAKIGIAAGLLKDVLSAPPPLDTVLFPLCGVFTHIFFTKFYFHKERLNARFLAPFFVSVFVLFAHIAGFSLEDEPLSFAPLILFSGIPSVLYTAAVAVPIFSILRKNYAP